MEDKNAKLIRHLDKLEKKLPEYNEIIQLFEKAIKHIAKLDSNVKDLINIVLTINKPSSDLIRKDIEKAFKDGIRLDDIIAAASLALLQLENTDESVLIPLIESLSEYDPVKKIRSISLSNKIFPIFFILMSLKIESIILGCSNISESMKSGFLLFSSMKSFL